MKGFNKDTRLMMLNENYNIILTSSCLMYAKNIYFYIFLI